MSADTLDFQRLVDARGQSLRLMPFEELTGFVQDSEILNINGRKGVISVIVERQGDDRALIVVQGFLSGRVFNLVQTVALHGFRKHASGAVSELEPHEFYDFD